MSNIQKKNIKGNFEKPNKPEKGRQGRIKTKTTIRLVAIDKYLPGKLLKKGNRVRTTKTINVAEMTDSVNHPV